MVSIWLQVYVLAAKTSKKQSDFIKIHLDTRCDMVYYGIERWYKMITKKELCKELGISPTTVDRHMAMGLPKVKLGKSLRFELFEVLEWYKKNPIVSKK